MNLSWLRPFLLKGKQSLVKNAPHILMALGTGGSVTAVIFAAKAAPKAREARIDAKRLKNEESEDIYVQNLTIPETIKVCGKFYIPAIGMELFSLLCFWGAHGIDVKRQALLAGTVYSMEQMLVEYQKKVVDMIGEGPEKEIRNAITQDHYDQNPPPQTFIMDPDADFWCKYKGYNFRSSYRKLKDIQNEANYELINHLYLSESDLLEMFDPDRKYLTPSGDSRMLGWSVDRLMEFDIQHAWGPDHQPALEIEIKDKDNRPYLPKPGFSASL